MTTRRLNPNTIFLHWLIFLLFLAALTGIEYREVVPSGDPMRRTLRTIHVYTGQLILLFSFVRVMIRLRYPVPPAKNIAPWMAWSALTVHALLYFAMFAQPISGVLFMQAGGKEVAFFNWVWPRMIAENAEVHFQIKEIHQFIGNAIYFLIIMHAAGALWHHFILKDDSLRHMLKVGRKD